MAKKASRSRADREEFRRDLIERQQQSGWSIREFCDEVRLCKAIRRHLRPLPISLQLDRDARVREKSQKEKTVTC